MGLGVTEWGLVKVGFLLHHRCGCEPSQPAGASGLASGLARLFACILDAHLGGRWFHLLPTLQSLAKLLTFQYVFQIICYICLSLKK